MAPSPGNPEHAELQDAADEAESKAWLTTYADMVTLLLTFFVLLATMSQAHEAKFREVMESIQYALGAERARGGHVGRVDLHDVPDRDLTHASGLEEEMLLKDLRQRVKQKNLDDVVQLYRDGRRLVIRVKGHALFASGSAELNPEAKDVLQEIVSMVSDYSRHHLDIKGHTDDIPISTPEFASNWELSAIRATKVLRYMVESGIAAYRMTATGYADTDPLAPNTSAANRALNRRVEFVLEEKEP
jgi:chemotaxis protein MotB